MTAETVCPFGMVLPHDAPVLPCWYCEGKDGDGQPYDPAVHHGWRCEACDERRRTQAVVSAAYDYIATHGHWPHDSECAHSLAHEAGRYEGEFMKDRHWVYDSTVKCDCKLGALSRAVLGYGNTQLSKPD